nr:hypothetical protein Itr_chr11CG25390 [Ipomoea trifida]
MDGEAESPARSQASEDSSEYSETIKVRVGDVELPMSPSLLDELMERSKRGEGDMETLISKHVMEEISKAIKRKTMAMADSCKLEAAFANEVESKLQELSKPKEQSEQGNGVMKPMKERDYTIPLSPKSLRKTNVNQMNANLEQEGKRNQENTKTKNGKHGRNVVLVLNEFCYLLNKAMQNSNADMNKNCRMNACEVFAGAEGAVIRCFGGR